MEEEQKGATWFSALPDLLKQAAQNPFSVPFLVVTIIGVGALWFSVQSQKETVRVLELQIQNCEQENDTERAEKNQYKLQRDDLTQELLKRSGYLSDSTKKH